MDKGNKKNWIFGIIGIVFGCLSSALPWIPIFHYVFYYQDKTGKVVPHEMWFSMFGNLRDLLGLAWAGVIVGGVCFVNLGLIVASIGSIKCNKKGWVVAQRALLILAPIALAGLFLGSIAGRGA